MDHEFGTFFNPKFAAVQHMRYRMWGGGLTLFRQFGRRVDGRQVRFDRGKAWGRAPHQQKGLTMKETLFALSLGFGAVILVTQAQAAPQCGSRAAVMAQLAERFGETRRSMGLAANNMVMETYVSDVSQSWTITVTTPEGQTCLLASGQGFEAMLGEQPAKGEPT
jgi:hypothetical protein